MAIDSWNSIVDGYNRNRNALESIIQSDWENYFTDSFVLGPYSKFGGEIESFRSLKAGVGIVKPDIIIRNRQSNKDLFVVELKQYNYPYNVEYEKQLISYMNLLELRVGILVCKTIRLYFLCSINEHISIEIPFVIDSADGEKFVELFKKGNFDEQNVERFIRLRVEKKRHILKIKQELQSLTFEKLLIEHFSLNYTEDEIREALSGMDFSVKVNAQSNLPIPINDFSPKNVGSFLIPTVANEYAEPNFKYIIIKIKKETVTQRGSVYEAVRYAWNAPLDKVCQYKYVFAVIKGIVKGVFAVTEWKYDTHGRSPRVEFIGNPAPTEISGQFTNKHIPLKYCKRGMASPILFSKN